ncbi:DUF4190 domain-containing protein [Cellulomonas sp. URHE0023]|uniref:DUF4190 domain-containing protein n=1 Tax=Cellulomonas sp. URHE0023 TaxID=1380354 RepID=UPI00068AD919|nr:DUF4190 domain-containing protein [Cellulomonas sp. URHE0023]
MSNEPGGSAPLPDPYTTPSGNEADRGPVPPPPSGYEAVLPPPAPYTTPGQRGGAPYASYAAPAPGNPPAESNPFAPPAAAAPSPYGSPAPAPSSPYGPPPAGAPYGQAPAYGNPAGQAHPYGVAPAYGQPPAYGQTPPPGYGTPYGATPYGYPGGPSQQVPTEPLAIASLVTSLVGLVFLAGLTGPVGLGLGIAALRRTRKNGKRGRGMAIAGIVVGAFDILFLLAMTAVVVALVNADWESYEDSYSYGSGEDDYDYGNDDDDTDDELTDDTIPDYTLRTDLVVGDCLDYYAYQWDMSDSAVVGCDAPHEGEVLATIPLSGPTNPSLSSDDPVWNAAWDACMVQATDLLHDSVDLGEVVLYAPHPDDFAGGATSGYCAFFTENPATGSAIQHTLTLSSAGSTT